jgi:hypothetical protein
MAYFPNGSSGEVLDEQCFRCPLGEKPCPVLCVQMRYNYDQLDAGQEKLRTALSVLVDDSGICQVRKQILEVVEVVQGSDGT